MRYIYISPLQIRLHRVQAKLSITQCCELAGVGRRTWIKWEETGNIPIIAVEMLKARSGTIWEGWYYQNGYLYDYAGRKYQEGDLMAAYYTLKAVDQDVAQFISISRRNLKITNKIESREKVNRTEPIAVPDFEKKQGSLGF